MSRGGELIKQCSASSWWAISMCCVTEMEQCLLLQHIISIHIKRGNDHKIMLTLIYARIVFSKTVICKEIRLILRQSSYPVSTCLVLYVPRQILTSNPSLPPASPTRFHILQVLEFYDLFPLRSKPNPHIRHLCPRPFPYTPHHLCIWHTKLNLARLRLLGPW